MTTGGGRAGGLNALRRRVAPRPATGPAPAAAAERCEMCAVEVGERHGHLADVADHRLLCVCRPCYLLFAPEGAGSGRYRAVGEDVRVVRDLLLDEAGWERLGIPVDLAFAFRQSAPDDAAATADAAAGSEAPASGDPLLVFYPGPGGATESLLDLWAWDDVVADNPVLGLMETDVEAALVRRREHGFSCHLVPIDVCYALVGLVRLHWTGLSGGPEVWHRMDAFFDDLDRRAVPVDRDGR